VTVLSDIQADLAGALFDEGGLAQSATYYPSGDPLGEGTIVSVLVDYGENLTDQVVGLVRSQQATMQVRLSEVAAPQAGDRIDLEPGHELTPEELEKYQFEGVENVERLWTVERILEGNGSIWVVAIRRDMRAALRR